MQRSENGVGDDAPGISEYERSVIRRGEAPPLSHSSGIGLWIASRSPTAATPTRFSDVDGDGSTVTLRFASEN